MFDVRVTATVLISLFAATHSLEPLQRNSVLSVVVAVISVLAEV